MRNNTQETYTIPADLVKLLDDYSKETMIPKSKLISKLLREFFEKIKNEK